jgi:Flp pilus assembly CpaE family ATPase
LRTGAKAMSNSRTYQSLVNAQEESESAGSSGPVNSLSFHDRDSQNLESDDIDLLSIALIGPDRQRRKEVASALGECRRAEVREFSSYPPALDDVPRLLEEYHDVILIDLDSNPEYALKLVESICAKDSATVMVYSARADREMVVRCMRAGAREYLTLPFELSTMPEALGRVAAPLNLASRQGKRTHGKMLVFFGAKGGSGVTTVACNLAVALAQESGQSTLLIDLGLPMGDAALNLGLVAENSTDNALLDMKRLDAGFLSKLLVKHRSGLSVLAAPSKVPKVQASNEAIDKLMSIASQSFENVVVDVGSRLDLIGTTLFRDAYTVFLVTQAGISELRNSNRLISQFFNDGSQRFEVVINRYDPRELGVSEEQITKALTKPARWKIPDDYSAARQMQSSAAPAGGTDSAIPRLFRQMARSVCGLAATPEKKASFSDKNPASANAEKASASEPAQPTSTEKPKIAWPTPAPLSFGTALGSAQLDAQASVPGSFVYTPSAGYVLPVGTHTLWVTFTPDDSAGDAPAQAAVSITVNKATPIVDWPAPGVIPSGKPLGSAELNAAASVPGTFVYMPAAGEVLAAGKHVLSVAFTPADISSYTPAQAKVEVTVATATPTLSWVSPAPISCGVALTTSQLNATASVPGIFTYMPAAGAVLMAGKHMLSVKFMPADAIGYTTAQAEVSLVVVPATPELEWPKPAPITYGTKLNAAQLNATASVPGSFAYIPAEGSVLAAGTHTPTVIFTPLDIENYLPAQAAVSLIVAKATPVIEWQMPEPIAEGGALGAEQLNATASVPGSFVYSPPAGEVLPAGRQTLSLAFTPMDTENYTPAQAAVALTVTKPAPSTITWSPPAAIVYGTPLGGAQLNARAPIPGRFVYVPPAGDVLTIGKKRLSVTFIPADGERYAIAQTTVTLVVEGLPPMESMRAPTSQTPFTHAASYMDFSDVDRGAQQSRNNSRERGKPETRTYKGAVYEKGEDGQWHLQQK